MPKAYLEFTEWTGGSRGGNKLEFQFNPKEFKVDRKARWSARSTSGVGVSAQYIGPEPREMTIEVFLDNYGKSATHVGDAVKLLFKACVPTSQSDRSDKPMPPKVTFGWDQVHIIGYIESVSASFTRFDADGGPIRATCTLKIVELTEAKRGTNPTSGTPELHRSLSMVAGDTLPGIAYREYGTAANWREIAVANGIDDPLRLRPGTRLLLPTGTRTAQEE